MRNGWNAGLALLGAALVGCASGGAGGGAGALRVASASARPSISHAGPARSKMVTAPEVMASQGLGGVIGSPAAALTTRFGSPRIDLAEGDAHKLQFTGPACVLDIFLYPLGAGAAPTATHVEARLRQGGAPADPEACIRELEQR